MKTLGAKIPDDNRHFIVRSDEDTVPQRSMTEQIILILNDSNQDILIEISLFQLHSFR